MRHRKQDPYIITTGKVLNALEETHLKRVCRPPEGTADKNGLMIMIALETGLRASELISLRVRDFNPHEQSIFVRSLKGSNPRELPLRPSRSRELQRFILGAYDVDDLSEIEAGALIFPISYQRLYQIWLLYRPSPKKTFHSLRHTFAVNFYMKCKDIRAVQLALGHRQISNTLVYVDFIYSQSKLRELMYG